ncbi:CGNR zinc finger domain-containing protein [Nocardioides fonticola]|uniref:CGNR zinc finger domain-containing protein n=1 Tax=Nocardioides fonticola TaxID=450363 RepID=A0ABP7XDS0_9ACTN
MAFTHDTEMALLAAVTLANTAEEPDTLVTIADLDSFFEEHEYTGRRDGTQAEFEAVRAVRHELRDLLTADRDGAVELVNRFLAEARAVPQLVRHGDYDWHIHATGPDEALVTRMKVETAMAMIDLIRADDLSRLGICADEDCRAIVLDLSRNRSKRFCSTTCGNRNAVAAYRARQAGA